MQWFFIINCASLHILLCSGKEIPLVEACKDVSDKEFAKNVDILLGSTVQLECNFCKIVDDFRAKLWYYKERGSNLMAREVELSMKTDTIDSKYLMTVSHQLVIQNFTLKDSGVFSCKHYNSYNDDVFIYVLDGIIANISIIKIGKISQWQDYKKTKLDILNEKMYRSENEPLRSINKTFGITFKMLIVWDAWSPCETQAKRKGIRRKSGKCYLRPFLRNYFNEISVSVHVKKLRDFFSMDKYIISCHSLTLIKMLPDLTKVTQNFSNYEITEACEASIYNTHDVVLHEKNEYKYKDTKHVGENSHVTLVCPEISLDSNVEWYKDNNLLNTSFRNNMAKSEFEPSITIDSCNTLYILHATKNEEAVYTCTVNGKKIKKIEVVVVSKSKLLNQVAVILPPGNNKHNRHYEAAHGWNDDRTSHKEFIRYSIYLGFVLSLTLTCYCTGICVAWHRRSSFADPLQLIVRRKAAAANCSSENEKLLP